MWLVERSYGTLQSSGSGPSPTTPCEGSLPDVRLFGQQLQACLPLRSDMVIVAAVDRSTRATRVVAEAEALAEVFDEPVHVVHVLTRSDFVELGTTRAESGDPVSMREVRETATDIAADAAEELDVPAETVGLVGDPAPRVVEYADHNDARYVVVSGRKRSPAGKALFGSVAQFVLLNAPCPVVSTTPQRKPE